MDTLEQRNSLLSLDSRKTLRLSGAEDILSFDETLLTVKTVCGKLNVEGERLHIGEFVPSDGVLTLDGKINALYYLDEGERKKRSFFGR